MRMLYLGFGCLAMASCGQSAPEKSSPSALVAGGAKAVSASLPIFLLPPPGSKIVESVADASGGGAGTLTIIESSATPDIVIAHYRKGLTGAGYTINDTFSQHVKVLGSTTLYGQKTNGDFVSVVVAVEDGKTQIALSQAER